MPYKTVRSRARPTDARTLQEARDAWTFGDWEAVLGLLTGIEPKARAARVEAAFLTARAALHAAQPARALAALDAVAAVSDGADEELTSTRLRGTALARLGRIDEAVTHLETAAADAAQRGLTYRAEAGYDLALAYFSAGRLDDAEAALDAHVSPSDGATHARALELFGWIEVRRQRYPIAARHFIDALDALQTLRPEGHRDGMYASLLDGMTSIALDTLDLKLFERVRDDVEAMPWAAPIQARWFAIRRNRALVELLEGNAIVAWRLADEALTRSIAGPQHVAALVMSARIGRAAGDVFTPQRLVQKATDIALVLDWDNATTQERASLLNVIRDAATIDAASAERLMTVYRRLVPAPVAAEMFTIEPRADALEDFARAALARVHGELAETTARLRAAMMIWRTTGARYDEAIVVLSLGEVAAGEETLRRADELTSVVPRSWLRRRFAVLAERARHVQQLSPAEHRVMMAICEGRSTAEIAARFGRSKNTIRNQTRRVYEVMEVRSRSSLVSKCAGLGIIAAGHSSAVLGGALLAL